MDDALLKRSNAELAKVVGDNIRAARTGAGWTQKRLSTECGLPIPQLCRLEKGVHLPKIGTVNRVALALGTTVADLVRGADHAHQCAGSS